MTEDRHFIMSWAELGKSVECKPLGSNRQIYDWWMDHLPIRAVQSHARVTGPDMNTWTVWLDEPALSLPAEEVEYMSMIDVPVGYGSLSYNERGGFGSSKIAGIEVIYGPLTEDMPFYFCYQVIDEDIETLKAVGQRVWNAIYKTKEIITVELTLKQ